MKVMVLGPTAVEDLTTLRPFGDNGRAMMSGWTCMCSVLGDTSEAGRALSIQFM